jgi:hypothetical protein
VFGFLGGVEKDTKRTYSVLAFRDLNGGSIDCDGEDSTGDGKEFFGEHHCVD